MDLVIVRSGRNPDAVCLAIGLALVSIYGLLFTPASTSIEAGLSITQHVLFGVCTVLGAGLTFVGIFWRTIDVGLLLERVGRGLLAIGAAVYVWVLCSVSTFDRSGLITTIACSIVVSSTWRCWQITRDLRRLRAAAGGIGTAR